MPSLTVEFYGPVRANSGFGYAARDMISSLLQAGVAVWVRDRHGRAVHSPGWPEIRPEGTPDFQMYYGGPISWDNVPEGLANGIAFTAWEFSEAPLAYRDILNRMREVWVPCRHNLSAFQSMLDVPVARIPPCVPRYLNCDLEAKGFEVPGRREEFTFYSVFVWQPRKGPDLLIRAYLQAFRASDPTVLVIKTNRDAEETAHRLLKEVRQETGSGARVEIIARELSEPEMQALHWRGDCYVSLHRGEGWGMPLFEAVCRGKIIVASGYSGPADFLDPACHYVVPFRMEPATGVRFYHEGMLWGEPDLGEATRLMRQAFEERTATGPKTHAVAASIRREFAPERVGRMAEQRLRSC